MSVVARLAPFGSGPTEEAAATCLDVALDLGATSVKTVAMDAAGRLVARGWQPVSAGQAAAMIAALGEADPDARLVAICGAGASGWADRLGTRAVPDLAAVCRGAIALVPAAGAVLEIGGERARFLWLGPGPDGRSRLLRDHRQNSVCSAGTGAFLEQEARRLGLTPQELGRLAASADDAPPIAGRCAVFARTDVVHRMQNGASVASIAAGLCRALVQAIRSELIGIRPWEPPLVLVGGVAASPGIVAALREQLGLADDALRVPPDGVSAAALGALLIARERGAAQPSLVGDALRRVRSEPTPDDGRRPAGPRLRSRPRALVTNRSRDPAAAWRGRAGTEPLLLGLDVGSTSTNLAILGEGARPLALASVPTRGRPLDAVAALLRRHCATFARRLPLAVGVTGSGRALAAGICGADLVINEVTAHAAAAAALRPEVESVFDIGGQDAKFIDVRDGRVHDFALNKACAAGTGVFLEEMAAQLGLDVRDGFADEAFRSTRPADLGERCAVFVASELRRRQREGVSRADLAAGLAYAVVRNYLARVVGRRAIGDVICMQGGVAGNAAVVAALEQLLGRPVLVHPCHEAAGAFGAALLAGQRAGARPVDRPVDRPADRPADTTRFRGFAWLDRPPPRVESFRCGQCENRCSIHGTRDGDGRGHLTGGLCDRHEGIVSRAAPAAGPVPVADLFGERQRLLERDAPASGAATAALGLPRALTAHELMPFWSAFLNELRVPWVASPPATRQTLDAGIARSLTGTCLPLRIAYGHCAQLQQAGAGRILAPSIANLAFGTRPERLSHCCSAVQAWPFTARAVCGDAVPWLTPTLRFAFRHLLRRDAERLGRELGGDTRRSRRALAAGLAAQGEFAAALADRGRELASGFGSGDLRLVILARPYTIDEPLTGLPLRRICRDLDVVAVPADCFPGQPRSAAELDGMYWYYGRRMLQTVRALRDSDGVAFVFLSNFGCGADSFLVHFLRAEIPSGRLLELELDQHGEFTGVRTRLEAFVDSLRHAPARRRRPIPITAARILPTPALPAPPAPPRRPPRPTR